MRVIVERDRRGVCDEEKPTLIGNAAILLTRKIVMMKLD